jgi:hypothetical protein
MLFCYDTHFLLFHFLTDNPLHSDEADLNDASLRVRVEALEMLASIYFNVAQGTVATPTLVSFP